MEQKMQLKNDSSITGVIRRVGNDGICLVWWDDGGPDYVLLEDLEPIHGGRFELQETVELVPDTRTYEFGVGDINNADDPYYAATQKTRKTGHRLIALRVCDGCGREIPAIQMMSTSMGSACPDCYDRMSN